MIRLGVLIALAPLPARAHGGHWDTLAGHDHWIVLGALGLAGLAGLGALVKGRGKGDDDAAAANEPDGEEAEA